MQHSPYTSSYNATLQRQYQRQRQRRQRQFDRTCLILSNIWKRRHQNKRQQWCNRLVKLCAWSLLVGTVLWSYHRLVRSVQKNAVTATQLNKNKNNPNHLSPAVIAQHSKVNTLSSRQRGVRSPPPAGAGAAADEQKRRDEKHQPDANIQHPRANAGNQNEVKNSSEGQRRQSSNKISETTATERRPITTNQKDVDVPSWLADYLGFHRRHVVSSVVPVSSRKNSTKHYQFASVGDEASAPPFLRWSCRSQSCGGLGDRVNGIVQAFFMAVCTDRVFLIDNSRDAVLPLLPNQLQWQLDERLAPPPAETQLQLLDNRNYSLLQNVSLLKQEPAALDIQTNLWMQKTNVQSPCWKEKLPPGLSAREFYRFAFDVLFQVPASLQEATDALRQRASLRQPFVGVHVRTGLVAGDSAQRHDNATQWRQFAQCARRVQEVLHAQQRCDSDVDIYLAADHVSVKEVLLDDDENNSAKIKTIRDLNVAHLDKITTSAENDDARMTSWSEWNLLRQAVCLVMSRSKFSETAAMLSNYGGYCTVYFDNCDEQAVLQAVRNVTVCQR